MLEVLVEGLFDMRNLGETVRRNNARIPGAEFVQGGGQLVDFHEGRQSFFVIVSDRPWQDHESVREASVEFPGVPVLQVTVSTACTGK